MAERASSRQEGVTAEDTQAVNEQEVRSLLRTTEGVTPQNLIGTGVTYRHNWGNRNGQWKLNLNWGFVNANTRVFVAISEGGFIGAARYTLHNVAPSNGVVSIWVNIEWSAPITLIVDYLAINP